MKQFFLRLNYEQLPGLTGKEDRTQQNNTTA